MKRDIQRMFGAMAVLMLSRAALAGNPAALTLQVDARDVSLGVQHVRLTVPVRPGPLKLAYPKWIPGEHAANGPLTQIVQVRFSSGGRTVAWRRDPLEPFTFMLDVPTGSSVIEANFDYLSPPKSFADGYGKSPNTTSDLVVLPFIQYVLYPAGMAADAIEIKADVLIPAGWKFDCALRPESVGNGRISLPQVSLYTLLDSPLLAGEYFRTVQLTDGAGATRLSIAADQPADLNIPDATVAGMKRVVAEATGLMGPGHYHEYVWLIALSDVLARDGLEHHECTDIRNAESLFTDSQRLLEGGRTEPHEYVHSWNAKYRRPLGLATRNYQEPMADDLLWVYEGMTRYLGDFVLRSRSGLVSADQARAYVAWIAAHMDAARPGRSWRSLADTATAIPAYSDAPDEWAMARRARDYYDEMLLVWLEADAMIRRQSGDQRSLDDFCRRFFAGPAGAPGVKPYTRAELVRALHEIAPLDWEGFFRSRIDAVNPHAPLQGLQLTGWRLIYDDTPNEFQTARDKVDEVEDLSLSLGLRVKADGTVTDVVTGSPAHLAGVLPAMRLLAIDGHKWETGAARDAIVAAEKSTRPTELIVESGTAVHVWPVAYHGGLRYPHLVRDAAQPDRLSQIMAARFSGAAQVDQSKP